WSREPGPVAHAPLHLLQMTFFCRDSFRVVPLYRSSRVTGSGCTTILLPAALLLTLKSIN
uniref:Uncharacterized protein n=1 Tax=Gopherus agassizii TaxID=38772 RepID=A0A452GYL3_9SAUR